MAYVNGPAKMPQAWIHDGQYEVQLPKRLSDGRVVSSRVPVEVSTKCLVDPQGLRMRQHGVPNSIWLKDVLRARHTNSRRSSSAFAGLGIFLVFWQALLDESILSRTERYA